jgi:hypothetical protein
MGSQIGRHTCVQRVALVASKLCLALGPVSSLNAMPGDQEWEALPNPEIFQCEPSLTSASAVTRFLPE